MRIVIAVATIALLGACREQAADNQAGGGNEAATAAANNASATAAAAPLGAPVSGEAAKKLMHDRHEGMEDIGDAFKIISREMKAASPDLAQVRENAATIARLAPQASGWFPPGTGPDVGKTRAKAEIWQKPQDFAAKSKAFEKAAANFHAAAQSGSNVALAGAHADLGKSCKACHDPYRAEEKEHD